MATSSCSCPTAPSSIRSERVSVVGGVLAVWAGIYVVASFVAQTSTCGEGHPDRLAVVIPAAMAGGVALMVGWWNRPERRSQTRRKKGRK